MAYENETYPEQCARIMKKLTAMCINRSDGKPCGAIDSIDFEDCCTPCQGARTINHAHQNWDRLVGQAQEVERLSMFQINALGGYG